MKITKLLPAAFLAFGIVFLQSCNTTDTPSEPVYELTFMNSNVEFNEDGYWAECYNPAVGAVTLDGFEFSHTAWVTEWAGVLYPGWKGFCPSRVNDQMEYVDDWLNHQWGCIASNPYNVVYFVGNSEAVVDENPLENDKCSVAMRTGGKFNPKYVYVTNSSYAYYCAKNGSAFNEPFTASDDFVLNVIGVRDGEMNPGAHLKFPLMSQGMALTQWAVISLEALGTVDKVLFYIDSKAKNEYGLTVPAYFCLANFAYNLPVESQGNQLLY